MITLSVEWNDPATGQRFSHSGQFNPSFAPAHAGELEEYARLRFETVFAELVRARERERARVAEEARAQRVNFPVKFWTGNSWAWIGWVPWELVARHERRVMSSFGSSLEELATVGGLTFVEIYEVLQDWPYGSLAASQAEARDAVVKLVQEFRATTGRGGSHLSVVR